jgi:hypothetical protein
MLFTIVFKKKLIQSYLKKCLVLLITNTVFQLYTRTSSTECVVSECLFIYLFDDDLVEIETCRKGVSHKRLFTTDCAIYCLKYCIINLLHGAWFTLNLTLCLLQYSSTKANLLLGGTESQSHVPVVLYRKNGPQSLADT